MHIACLFRSFLDCDFMDNPDSPEKIFRQDFIDGKKQRWLGHAILISEVPSYWFVLGTTLVIAVLLSFVVFAEFTRRINVNGEVISSPQPSTILAPQNGTIIQSHLTAGQFVQKDQPLLQLDVSRSSNQGNSSREALLAVKKQLFDVEQLMTKLKQDHSATQDNLNSQLEKTKQIYQRSNQRYVAAQKGLSQMHKMAEDYAAYLKKGWVTREQVNQLRYLYYERQNAVENIYNQLAEQAISIKAIEKEINNRRSELNSQLIQHQVQYNDLIRQQAELNANHIVVIKAPQAGYIENIIADQGKMVSTGDSLLQLSPSLKTQYSVILWLPNSSLPYLQVGDAVNLRYHAFPYEKFGQFAGNISHISRVPATPHELTQFRSAPQNIDAAYYKVTVSPKKNQIQWQQQNLMLSSGMKTEATLFLEKRPIYQWILAPFYDIANRITGAERE